MFSNVSLKQREAKYFPSRLIDEQLETPELSNLQEEKVNTRVNGADKRNPLETRRHEPGLLTSYIKHR